MICVLCPEPADWLEPVVRMTARSDEVVVIAPWVRKAGLGSRLSTGLARRIAPPISARIVKLPGWSALDALSALWARQNTERSLRRRFALRALMDRLVSQWLPKDTRVVVAPACGAARTFARAARRELGRMLISDLPSLRELHADLDDAARAHPDCSFLRNYRAPQKLVARQEMERSMATQAVVRSRLAQRVHLRAGITAANLLPWPVEPNPIARPVTEVQGQVLLAGLASARAGSVEALGLIEACPELTLLVRPGEGTEPRRLLQHPRVRPSTRLERETLKDVSAVIAPSWCESNPVEIARAVSARIPVVATERAAGFYELERVGAQIRVGDVEGLNAAVTRVLRERSREA